MTTDDLKMARDGHLTYGPVAPKDYPRMVEVCPVVRVERNGAGEVTGFYRSDGGIGEIYYSRKPA